LATLRLPAMNEVDLIHRPRERGEDYSKVLHQRKETWATTLRMSRLRDRGTSGSPSSRGKSGNCDNLKSTTARTARREMPARYYERSG